MGSYGGDCDVMENHDGLSFFSVVLRTLAYPVHLLLVAIVQGATLAQLSLAFWWLRVRTDRPPASVRAAHRKWMARESRLSAKISTVSVIIPVLDEADVIERCLTALALRAANRERVEVIIVDGGCTDGTMDAVAAVADDLTARQVMTESSFVIRATDASGGRGPALNAGIEVANGDVLLMLHAGTIVPDEWDRQLVHALMNPELLAVAFRFGFDRASLSTAGTPKPVGLWMLEWASNWRSRWLRLPLGDQVRVCPRAHPMTPS